MTMITAVKVYSGFSSKRLTAIKQSKNPSFNVQGYFPFPMFVVGRQAHVSAVTYSSTPTPLVAAYEKRSGNLSAAVTETLFEAWGWLRCTLVSWNSWNSYLYLLGLVYRVALTLNQELLMILLCFSLSCSATRRRDREHALLNLY